MVRKQLRQTLDFAAAGGCEGNYSTDTVELSAAVLCSLAETHSI